MPSFTAGQVSIGIGDTPCPEPRPGTLDPASCGPIAMADAADLSDKIYGSGAPPVVVALEKMPEGVQTSIAACNTAGDSCKFVAYDFETNATQSATTMSHVIDTRASTTHDAGIFYKTNKPPVFNTIPGYSFDPIYSYNRDTRAPKYATVVDERYCARACDADTKCFGFNYETLTRKCYMFSGSAMEADVYMDGVVSYTKEDNPKVAQGSDPAGTNLTNSGTWCGSDEQIAACNGDISNVIQNSTIQSFSTMDLVSCSACPSKSVVKTGTNSWAFTNEIETTTISTSATDVISKLNYKSDPAVCETNYTQAIIAAAGNATALTAAASARTACLATHGRATTSITLQTGKFYKISPYLPSSSFVPKTCLYMANLRKLTVSTALRNNQFLMSGTFYTVPDGTYTGPQLLVVLNRLTTGGTFSYLPDDGKYKWVGSVIPGRPGVYFNRVLDIPGPLSFLGFGRLTSGTTIMGSKVDLFGNGGFLTYYAHGLSVSSSSTTFQGTASSIAAATDKMFVFSTLGSNASATTGIDGGVPTTNKRFEPIKVDYVDNGFVLLDPESGKYMVPGSDDSQAVFLPSKYSTGFNALVFRISESSFQNFIDEVTAINGEQPLIIRKTIDGVPYIIDPTPDAGDPGRPADPSYFQVQQFPSMTTFNSYLAANPSWAKYVSSRTLTYSSTQVQVSGQGGGGQTTTTSSYTRDMRAKVLVSSENFWNTVHISERVEVADPATGCADPDDPAAYEGGECQLVNGKVTFCELCAAGTFSLPSNPKTMCTTDPANALRKTMCTVCTTGSYCPAGSGSQQDCPAGYYCPTPAQKLDCPAGSYCPARSTAPTACIAGDYCPAHSAAAMSCEAGNYCPSTVVNNVTVWGASQTLCPVKNYCPARATAPIPCVDPAHPDIAFYCPPGTRTLNQCPGGSICSDSGTIQSCTEGHYCPWGSSVAKACEGSTYYVPLVLRNIQGILQGQTNVNAPISACYSCPAGTTATADKAGCVCAAPLIWSAYNNKCIANCPAGQADNGSGTGCVACGDNKYTPVTGLPKCMPCATNFTSVHKPDHTGCICTETIGNGTLVWDQVWNRCKVTCNGASTTGATGSGATGYVPYWSRCFPRQTTAVALAPAGGRPPVTAYWDCPKDSNNHYGEGSGRVCFRGSNRKATTPGGVIYNYSCPANWAKNGGGNWNDQGDRNLSCRRGAIITSHFCPPCWRPSYSYKNQGCPPGSALSNGLCRMAATFTAGPSTVVPTSSGYNNIVLGGSTAGQPGYYSGAYR